MFKNIRTNHLLINPFILYGLIWIAVITIYELEWSNMYPPLSIPLKLFFYFTSIFSFLVGLFTNKCKIFEYHSIELTNKRMKFIKKFMKFIIVLSLLEILICRQLPLFSLFSSIEGLGKYTDFGLPIIHVIIVTGFIFIFTYIVYIKLSNKDNLKCKKLNFYLFICVLYGILIVNRGYLMHLFVNWVIIFLMSKQSLIKHVLKILLICFGVLFVFGLIGGLRSSQSIERGRQYILIVGDASEKFKETKLPAEFFWAYTYIASPLSNIQYTYNKIESKFNFSDLFPFLVNNTFPETISKRLGIVSERKGLLNSENLNVGSVYFKAYAEAGWIGMIIMYIFMYIFIILILFFISKQSDYFVPSLSIISTIIVFNIFDNMFIFSGLLPSLYFPIFFVIKKGLNKRRHRVRISKLQQDTCSNSLV